MKEKIRYLFRGNSQLVASGIAALILMVPVVCLLLSAVFVAQLLL